MSLTGYLWAAVILFGAYALLRMKFKLIVIFILAVIIFIYVLILPSAVVKTSGAQTTQVPNGTTQQQVVPVPSSTQPARVTGSRIQILPDGTMRSYNSDGSYIDIPRPGAVYQNPDK